MLLLLRFSAATSARRTTFRRSTLTGAGIPSSSPKVLIHWQREL
jgi:hypothetical protein